MKGSTIALDRLGPVRAAALVVDGVLEDLLVDGGLGAPPAPGSIYLGIADRPAKGQGGHFVKLPDGLRGFLRRADGVRHGQAIPVQVVSHPAEDGKAVPLTSRLLFKGRYAIVTPEAPGINLSRRIVRPEHRAALTDLVAGLDLGSHGAILRSRAADAAPEAVLSDLAEMAARASRVLRQAGGTEVARLMDGPGAHELALRDWPDPDVLDDAPGAFARIGVLDMIAALASPRIDLPGGGSAWIEPTRAVIAVDVNTGPDTSPAAGLKANLALFRALPRQLRCRGLGGQIVIDLAPMAKRDRRQVETAVRSAFGPDPVETTIAGWTPLGNLELQRKRERLPLAPAP